MQSKTIGNCCKRLTFLFVCFGVVHASTSPVFAKGDEFKALEQLQAGEKFAISRLVEDATEHEVLQALKDSLELEGYVIEVFEPELGVVSAVKNKRTKAPKSQVIEGMKLSLFGTMASDDPELEEYSSFVTRAVGVDGKNILVQRRELTVHWGVKGSIVNVGVEPESSNYDAVFYLLSKALNKPVKELK